MDIASELVSRARSGDAAALDELLRRIRDMVGAYCWGRLRTYPGGTELAQDVAQEVTVAAWQGLAEWKDTGAPLEAWVYAIAKNKVASAHRRRSTHGARETGTDIDELSVADESPGPEEQLLTVERLQEDTELLEQLLATLPEHKAYVLRAWANKVPAEKVARSLGMKVGNVRVMQHRALRELGAR